MAPVVSEALGFEAVLSSCVRLAELTNCAEPGLGLPCSFTSCYSPAFVRPASSSRPGVSKAALRLSSPTWEVQEETHPSRLSVRSLSLHFSWKPKRAAMLSFNLSLSLLYGKLHSWLRAADPWFAPVSGDQGGPSVMWLIRM